MIPTPSIRKPPVGSPENPFLYDAPQHEIEKFFLLALLVVGKNAAVQHKKLEILLREMENTDRSMNTRTGNPDYLPFESLHFRSKELFGRSAPSHTDCLDALDYSLQKDLRRAATGQYRRMSQALRYLARIPEAGRWLMNPKTYRYTLRNIPGVGMKTASFFLMYTRRDAVVACLDTHVLKFMVEAGLVPTAPKATPGNVEKYMDLEDIFLAYCASLGKPPGAVDFTIWQRGSGHAVVQDEGSGYWYHWLPEFSAVHGPFPDRKTAAVSMRSTFDHYLKII